MNSRRQILDAFSTWDLDSEARSYLKYHCLRYLVLLDTVDVVINSIRESREKPSVLDIGPAYQTELMRRKPNLIVSSVGFEDPRFKPRAFETHYQFDLNDSQDEESWPLIHGHDVIVMAEVLEHLYTSPKLVLACIVRWLNPGGYLIMQTPNAVALRHRLKMLKGMHPYEMIRETRDNPGHFREYTKSELINLGRHLGLKLVRCTMHNYFRHPGTRGWIYNSICRLVPENLKDGITIYFQKVC